MQIAQEWDGIEKALQSDDMWYFLTTGATSPSSRIEFVFDQIAGDTAAPIVGDSLATFHFYNERVGTEAGAAEDEWQAIKRTFMTLEEWFNDRRLYHLVGYLVHDGYRLADLRKAANDVTKSQFRLALRDLIFHRLTGQRVPPSRTFADYKTSVERFVNSLYYDANRKAIRSLLLLFNIATIVLNPKSNLRFPFHHYKKARWDIEHVRSVKSDKPDQPPPCREWLRDFVEHLGDVTESSGLCARARTLLASELFTMEDFDRLYVDVLAAFQESDDTETDNGVGNLALLDSSTNRSYGNAVFPVKRSRIVALDRKGTFVPICTKNVFLKCYSKEIGKMMFWGRVNRDAYRASVVETLATFFAKDIPE